MNIALRVSEVEGIVKYFQKIHRELFCILVEVGRLFVKRKVWRSRGKALAFTVAPFGIPLIFSVIPDSFINNTGKIFIVLLLFIIDTYGVMKITVREDKELVAAKEIINANKKYQISRKILNRLANCEKIKGSYIQDETYKIHYDYKENVLLYNPHRFLERVCDEIKSLISDITRIDLEYVSVSYIYKYPLKGKNYYEDESEKWKDWKWITGKDSTSNFDLNELIRRKDSYYHYLIAMYIRKILKRFTYINMEHIFFTQIIRKYGIM